MSEENKDFVVKDRRFSAEETTEKKESASQEETASPSENSAAQAASKTPEAASMDESPGENRQEDELQMPEINFSTFIFSLNASALVNLGGIENPDTGKKEKNLPLAKQTIDILGMLEEKTRGNLTGDEENLLKNLLYDLRLYYVKAKG